MVEQLRQNARVRETFGRYIDPRVVEDLIDRPAVTADRGPTPGHDGAVLRHEGVYGA